MWKNSNFTENVDIENKLAKILSSCFEEKS
jgi:hypothetical protein